MLNHLRQITENEYNKLSANEQIRLRELANSLEDLILDRQEDVYNAVLLAYCLGRVKGLRK